MGVVATTISTFLSEQPLYILIGDKAELCRTIEVAQRYLATVRSTLRSLSTALHYAPPKYPDSKPLTDTNASINAHINADVSGFCNIVRLFIEVSQTPIMSFYRGGSSSQPPSHEMEHTRWEAKITLHSSTEKDDGDEDNDRDGDKYRGRDKDKDKGRDEDEYEGQGEDEEDEDDDHDQ
ncbi:hypothetical protein Goshw_023336 [Gossypium schwendimanii]|uniref:Uncharacterized protein n=1 Tax=Gossypium schwendimanii TaxID=34291 RepID=A0A7J9M6T7_GOSSC|nr:hypothetical protein [Gossypium schwendimanii]